MINRGKDVPKDWNMRDHLSWTTGNGDHIHIVRAPHISLNKLQNKHIASITWEQPPNRLVDYWNAYKYTIHRNSKDEQEEESKYLE